MACPAAVFVHERPANRVAVVDGLMHDVIKYLLVRQRVWHMRTHDRRSP
jgi:hypothetical protein